MGVRIEERRLAGDRCGIYYDPLRLIILDERLAGFQRRCTLCHELIHARHHDPGCGSQYGIKCERRCRRETALALISPVDYGMAETVYEGNTWMMAVEWILALLIKPAFQGLHNAWYTSALLHRRLHHPHELCL